MSTTDKPTTDAAAAAIVEDADRVRLPGFGLPHSSGWVANKAKFPHALESEGRGKLSRGLFLRERRMLDFMGSITDKPEWERKVFDEEIVGKWRAEAMEMPTVDDDDVYMSDDMFDYCIAELRDKAERLKKTGFVTTFDAEVTIVKSDTAVSDELAAALKKCVAKLEDVPERDKDWHPGSDDQVLDLLHPSLYPVVFGATRALTKGTVPLDDCAAYTGRGEVTELSDIKPHSYNPFANHEDLYQWLPADVTLSEDGSASITSYINNLHPRVHKELYGVLEKFVAASVPLWEEALTPYGDRRRIELDATDDDEDYYIPEGIVYEIPREDGEDGEDGKDSSEYDDEEYKYTDEYQEWWYEHRVLEFREPKEYVPFDKQTESVERVHLAPTVDTPSQFPKGLQVIFKLANIHLTPEKPSYGGGSWHIEGTLSERICASALYYYDEENITPSQLSFRQCIDEQEMMMIPAQSMFTSLLSYLGIDQYGTAVHNLGSVLTRPGRLLVFPNVLQHRVGSFELQDATKPGHRKILAMFLIDPSRRVLSSANVPPQRKDWWSEYVHETPALSRLPNELFSHVIDLVDEFPLSWEQAVKIRADLMEKRSAFTEDQENEMNDHTFSFCEH
ncbi:hypothetical protein HMPREF1624_02169 [Sporothrix schenckii ATCC 58251]|uniref:Uncharacterized protein n=1 Tax=Sporothrix schenckii (strain ATCC 58251 / de Perez 2211183) TaxID=1391915 RepID=U7Q1T8_SPOS1|nr:hypothetical protein HMPREF1624_02169 [Sporothrix schenckii ATCC 58251]